ncbi:MAG: hypothetical protein SF052_11335 [Bacteroidia bacterium]|nr:hypothetical protein [Bacteroidia bacterium]
MIKRIEIQDVFDYQCVVIGLASHEHIWKLCYEVNLHLGLNLTEKELEKGKNGAPHIPEKKPDQGLFEDSELTPDDRPLAYYEDLHSDSRFEFILCKPDPNHLPKDARPFRFFFLVRAHDYPLPGSAELVERLSQLPTVLSAVDISHIKNIKQLVL